MRRKFREEERDKRKREERRDGDGDGGGAVGVGDGPRKLRCGHSTVNRCKLRYSVQSPASPESCDCLYNHVDVTPPPAVSGLKWHAVVYIFQSVLFFWFFFLLYSTRQTPRCFGKLLLLKSRLLNFCSYFALSASFFGFSSGSSCSRGRGFLVTMSQDTGLFSIKRPREVCDSHSFWRITRREGIC